MSTASGAYFFTSPQMALTMPALTLMSSSRDWPGLRGTPAVMTTTSAPAMASALSLAAKLVLLKPSQGPHWVRSSARPSAGPALRSMSTRSPSSFCAAH